MSRYYCLISLLAICLSATSGIGSDKAPACSGDELGCAFSLESKLPSNDEAYSQCFLHDQAICPEGWTYSDDITACTNMYSPLTSIAACAETPEACDLLAYCGLPSDFEPATATSLYFASILKNIVEADDCPRGWSFKGSNCVKMVTTPTPESFSPSYGGSNDDGGSRSNGAAQRNPSVAISLFAIILAASAAFARI
jgi:hypothetical protein